MKLDWALAILATFGLASVPAQAEDQGPEKVGVLTNPCAQLPPQPAFVREYIAAMRDPAKRQVPRPALSPGDAAALKVWQNQKLLADYADLCRYEAQNASLPSATAHRVVFFGDSITEAWSGARPGFFKGDRINRGISGQTTGQMLGRFQADVIALRPTTVHILAGTNDLAGNTGATTIARISNNIRSMVDLARVHRIRVILGTVLPVAKYGWRPGVDAVFSVRALNNWLHSYARAENIELIDYFAVMNNGQSGLSAQDSIDGVHPTTLGYAKMEAALEPAFQRSK